MINKNKNIEAMENLTKTELRNITGGILSSGPKPRPRPRTRP